jgi:quercetin dioxygenase-like cupin family protein
MPEHVFKNVEFSMAMDLPHLVDYQEGQVVSRTMVQTKAVSVTLFAFAKGEGLSSHTAAGDALVQVLDGTAALTIGDKRVDVHAGQAAVMPARVPHAVDAEQPFKMLLTVVKVDGS